MAASTKTKLEVLRAARRNIKLGGLICDSLRYQGHYMSSEHKTAAAELVKYVLNQLSPNAYFTGWLRRTHGINPFSDRAKLTATRVAWVDWCIACLEEDDA